MHETGEEDDGQRCTIVLEEHSQGVTEETAGANLAADVCNHEDKKSRNYGEVELLSSAKMFEDLDAFLKVDEGDVEAEDVAGEASHPSEPVAGVCYGEDPVKNERPSKYSQSDLS